MTTQCKINALKIKNRDAVDGTYLANSIDRKLKLALRTHRRLSLKHPL
jgi:hypothetical protein